MGFRLCQARVSTLIWFDVLRLDNRPRYVLKYPARFPLGQYLLLMCNGDKCLSVISTGSNFLSLSCANRN